MNILLGLTLGIVVGWLLQTYLPSTTVKKVNDFVSLCRSKLTELISKAAKSKDKLAKIDTTKQTPLSH